LAFDRDVTLKKAEKLLRQGRLDAAIAEYLRVVEDQPRDWNTANTLGDLYARGGQTDKAVQQYTRIADHFLREGFYPKAGALYKKILKIQPDDESIQLVLAEVSTKQGLLADAKTQLHAVADRRRARGDHKGAAEIAIRVGTLDPSDFDARHAAARIVEEMGDTEGAAARYRAIHDDLLEKGRTAEALEALRHVVRLNPQDHAGRAALVRTAVQAGNLESAAEFLTRESAGDDPELLGTLAEIELTAGRLDGAREVLAHVLSMDRARRHAFLEKGWSLTASQPDQAFVWVDASVDAAVADADFTGAAEVLQRFGREVPRHVPALLKLVEVCVDGGLETTMYQAQVQLTDAYLETGQAAEARVIAEDLVAREPWEGAHIERFRRALTMLRVFDPDTHIADRLSGASPFTAKDPFVDLRSDPSPVAETANVPTAAAASGAEEVEEVEALTPEPADTAAQQPASGPTPPPAPALPSIEQIATPVAVAPPPSPARETREEEIDLTGALGELKPRVALSGRESLEEVFEDLRTDASETADEDFSAQYMKLARTYLDMNMVEEAMGSLQTAAKSPEQRFEAASLLARLHTSRGETERAVEWFERASEAPAPTAEDGRALLYDLGVVLDGAGETARALAVFLELQADAGDYRDVPARIGRLARVQTGG
jgi:tetratricopeptide (TPR) repeat protein